MSYDAPSPSGQPDYSGLLLLECDVRGQLLWMSGQTRSALGAPSTVAEAVRSAELANRALRFSGVWLPSGIAWIIARTTPRWQFAAQETLGPLERGLLRHYFLLEQIDRQLWALARLRRPRTSAARVLELERQRVARDLHTGVGQVLAAIRLQAEVIASGLAAPPEPVREAMERIGVLVENGLDQARALAHRLHPPEWQRLTLEAAIRQLWDLSGIPQQFDASLRIEPMPEAPELEVKSIAYRTAQEAFSNIVLHANATHVEAALEAAGGWLRLTIRDNGRGFDVSEYLSRPASVSAGIGLRSIREQAIELGGRLQVNSGPNGTTVELSIPLHNAEQRNR